MRSGAQEYLSDYTAKHCYSVLVTPLTSQFHLSIKSTAYAKATAWIMLDEQGRVYK